MKKETLLNIPPFWIGIISSLVFMPIVYKYIRSGVEPHSPTISPQVALLLLFCMLIYSCVSYSLTLKYICVKLFGITVRKVKWESISGAAFYLQDKEKPKGVASVVLAISPYRLNAVTASKFLMRGYRPWFNRLRLLIPIGQEEHVISVIKQCLSKENTDEFILPNRKYFSND